MKWGNSRYLSKAVTRQGNMTSPLKELNRQIRQLNQELNLWHELIFTPIANRLQSNLDSSYEDKENEELLAALEKFNRPLIYLFKRKGYHQAAIVVLNEWNKNNLTKTYIQNVITSQLCDNDDE